jgi:hypothetical protein
MGIKNYLTNITELFPKILEKRTPKNIDILCVDLNTILHKVCHKSTSNLEFENKLIKELNILLKKFKPKTFALFTDGQAVLAKAQLQIKRRDKYLYSKTSDTISTLNLTPGTPFMEFVDTFVNNYLNKLDIDVYYSSSKIKNEGELKMFSFLKNKNESKICIVGNDADLIVLALANTPLLNLYIYNLKNFISLYKLVDSLSNFSEVKFNYKYHPIRKDMVLISLLLGNDYNKNLVNFKNILSSYKLLLKEGKGYLFKKNGYLNFRNILLLLKNLEDSNTSNDIIYSQNNVNNYFNSLLWNINLYNGVVVPNYLPNYKINVKTILAYFPKKIKKNYLIPKWQDTDVYLLLLMPSVGKEYLPDHLKKYMEKKSPIKDLFPDPCPTCIEFKSKISSYDDNTNIELIRNTNDEYKNHIEKNHKIINLPLKRIQDALLK